MFTTSMNEQVRFHKLRLIGIDDHVRQVQPIRHDIRKQSDYQMTSLLWKEN